MTAPVVTLFREVRRRSPPHRASGCGCIRRGVDGSGFLFRRHREREVSGRRGRRRLGSGLARLLGRFASSATVLDDASIPLAQAQDAEMVEENTRLVKEAAARGVVILGRNGALILGDIPTALHVQLDAPVEVRIARAVREEGIDEALAARRQRNEDRVRAEMSERFYHWNPMAIDRYHLVLNTGCARSRRRGRCDRRARTGPGSPGPPGRPPDPSSHTSAPAQGSLR